MDLSTYFSSGVSTELRRVRINFIFILGASKYQLFRKLHSELMVAAVQKMYF
jgi:hypothetical protein